MTVGGYRIENDDLDRSTGRATAEGQLRITVSECVVRVGDELHDLSGLEVRESTTAHV